MIHDILDRYHSDVIIKILSEYLTEHRIQRIENVLLNRISSAHLAVESVYDIHNAMAAVRSAEAQGVDNIHLITDELKKNRGRKTSRGANRWVSIQKHRTLSSFSDVIHREGLHVAGACLDGSCTPDDLPVDQPLCILFGNEHRGLSDEAMVMCDTRFKIPMFGMTESYNLSVSVAITLHDYAKRKRAYMEKNGDLTDEQLLRKRAEYYIRAVGQRRALAIIPRVVQN